MAARSSKDLGVWLKRARLAAGWTQEELAERAGLSVSSISKLERAGLHRPRKETLQLLAQALHLPPEEQSTFAERIYSSPALPPPVAPLADLVLPTASAAGRRVDDPTIPPRSVLPKGLVGREPLLQQLKEQLMGGDQRALYALQGLPGVGKTALALALAHDAEVRSHFADGMLWAGLGQSPHVQETLARWGALLGLPPSQASSLSTPQAWAQTLRTVIGERRFLLVLDDAWRLEDVLACQVGGESCAYLVTTRHLDLALQVEGERLVAVSELPEEEGLTLLAHFAAQVVKAEPEEARALVRTVGGLPLALVLLGKYLHSEAYHQQPRRLRAALERLQQATERMHLPQPQALLETHPSLPARTPLSLAASIGLSLLALSEEAQAMLRALAAFPPKPISFSEGAALQVSQGTVQTLDRLVDAGLVENAGPGRYSLHQTIIDFARLPGAQPGAEQRYVAWAVDWITTHQEESLLEQELPLLLDALRRAGGEQERALFIQGSTTLAPFLLDRGWYTPAEGLLQQALTAARALEDQAGLLQSYYHLSRIAERRGDYDQAETLLQTGIRIAREEGDPDQLGIFLMGLGYHQSLRGELRLAQDTLEAALTVARQGGTIETQSRILGHLGAVIENQGYPTQAIPRYQEAWELAQQANRPYLACAALDGLTSAALRSGDYAQAQTYGQAEAALARQHGYRGRLAAALNNLGVVALDQGRFRQAEEAFGEALQGERVLGQREGICRALLNLGEVHLRLGQLPEAEPSLEEALRLARQLDHRQYACHALRLLGELQLQQGDLAAAEATLEEGIALARASEYRWVLSGLLSGWGDVQIARHHGEAAQAVFSEALLMARQIESQELEAAALYGLARLAASQGDLEQAYAQGQQSWQLYIANGLYQAAGVQHWLDQFAPLQHVPSDEGLVEARAQRNGHPRQGPGATEALER